MFLLHFPVHLRFISPLDLKKKTEKENKDQVSTEKKRESIKQSVLFNVRLFGRASLSFLPVMFVDNKFLYLCSDF